MAKFFVGQMVRVDDPSCHEHGKEARVLGLSAFGRDSRGSYCGVEIDIPCQSVRYPFCVFRECELIPITRPDASTETDRNKVVPWSDCEWMPDHLRERA